MIWLISAALFTVFVLPAILAVVLGFLLWRENRKLNRKVDLCRQLMKGDPLIR